ncbi:MAG: acyl-CoA dehydrogenase [Bdellovibrionales bacterium]|nr:acyl-CoA dehydrogenase [Bdellovibrionales bacterium]
MFLFILFVLLMLILTFYGNIAIGWFGANLITFFLWAQIHPGFWFYACLLIALSISIVFFFPPVRKQLLTPTIFKLAKGMLPTIGETERIALEAGTVWWDKELFSGAPNFPKMFSFYEKPLSDEEQAFLNGPVEKLCHMIDDWNIQQRWDMPLEAWDFIKKNKFFGMIIPKEYGGLGFSARAHSEVVLKLGSRSTTAAVTVMVPNSLGPAELILQYGTDEQKNYYLPRLATGEEIPCFGLTEPTAGSDAGGMRSIGVVCKETFDGHEVTGIRLNWEKRWITLSPIATVLGIAFVLHDPDHLLGDQDEVGITCALIPSDVSGVHIGRRHNPLHSSFYNGPTWGKDVFIPLDYIIGGPSMAGQGWRMLMECLAVGRSISLPALSIGNAKLSLRTAFTYANIREQFNLPIARFEGVEEKLADIIGWTYLMDAARTLTVGGVDTGEHPSVISAIMKAYTTELGRKVVNHAMDIRAGAEITLGPKNILGNIYTSLPISITVEGANILTRTLIIYGQGAIRCHPFIQSEIEAIGKDDVDEFDQAFFGHIAFVSRNAIRAFLLSLTNGVLAKGHGNKHTASVVKQLSRMSANFSFLSDTCMGVLGGALKRKEKLSGRLADCLSWMYLTTATVKRYLDHDKDPLETPIMLWASQYGLYQVQEAMIGVLQNLGFIGAVLRRMLFPWGRTISHPSDHLGHKVVQAVYQQGIFDRLTHGMFIPQDGSEGLGLLEKTYATIQKCKDLDDKIKNAIKEKTISKGHQAFEQALEKDVITELEYATLVERENLKLQAIQVDDFDKHEFSRRSS